MSIGTIKKLVRVPPVDQASATDVAAEGYGIILGADGCEVFFLDSVVDKIAFCELQRGQTVLYEVEEGPLRRAARVMPCSEDHPGAPLTESSSH